MIQSSQLAQSVLFPLIQSLDEQSENWEEKYKILAEKIANVEHEHKKIVNEVHSHINRSETIFNSKEKEQISLKKNTKAQLNIKTKKNN